MGRERTPLPRGGRSLADCLRSAVKSRGHLRPEADVKNRLARTGPVSRSVPSTNFRSFINKENKYLDIRYLKYVKTSKSGWLVVYTRIDRFRFSLALFVRS